MFRKSRVQEGVVEVRTSAIELDEEEVRRINSAIEESPAELNYVDFANHEDAVAFLSEKKASVERMSNHGVGYWLVNFWQLIVVESKSGDFDFDGCEYVEAYTEVQL